MPLSSLLALFGAGLLTFASPCVLPMLPVYLSVLGGAEAAGAEQHARRRLRLAGIGFAVGLSLVFIALGVGASALAGMLSEHRAREPSRSRRPCSSPPMRSACPCLSLLPPSLPSVCSRGHVACAR